MNTQTTKTFANFNTVSFQGRVFNVKVVDGQYGEFAAITVITNLQASEDKAVTLVFNNGMVCCLYSRPAGFLMVAKSL